MVAMNLTPTAPQPVAPTEDKHARRPTKPLPQALIEASSTTEPQSFNASRHVNFEPPKRVYTMDELGLAGQGIVPTAISDPFPLFTEEAVQQMRRELFSQNVLDKHQYASSFCDNMIRGHCPEDAPFIYDAWNDPVVLGALSQIAGIELVPAWPYDIGNVNVSYAAADSNELADETSKLKEETDLAAFGWHYDSVPFVCVTMLSDCRGMIGGETAIRTKHGTHWKMRGPAMGTAIVMQGRYIEHQALKALGNRERISMVCSLRPKSALVKDESVLTGVRGISYVPELYYQYASYRMANLEERIRDQQRKIKMQHASRRDFDLAATRDFLLEQKEYIESMLTELVDVNE